MDRVAVDRLETLSQEVMDRFLSIMRAASPDPRLSYPRYRFLAWIESAGRISVGDIAANLGIARSTASEMIGRLVRDGLVSKSSAHADGRSVQVELTPLGQRLIRRRRKDLWYSLQMLVNSMTSEERDEFVGAFETMNRVMRRVTRA